MATIDAMELWKQWDGKHDKPEQIKRQSSSVKGELTPVSTDQVNFTGIFKGSKQQYFTTLTECECTDFKRRKLPCKHMYRLAYEFKLIQATSDVIKLEVSPLNKNEAMKLIVELLSLDEQKAFGYFCYQCGNNNQSQMLVSADFSDKLLSNNFAQEITDPQILLQYLPMKTVRTFLPPDTKSPRTKDDLIALVAPFVKKEDIILPDNKKCLTLHPSIAHLGHTLHRQIVTMYPEEDLFLL